VHTLDKPETTRSVVEPTTPETQQAVNAVLSYSHRFSPLVMRALVCIGIIAVVLSLTWMGSLLAVRAPLRMHWSTQMLVATGPLVLVALMSFREWRHWRRPTRQLEELIARARLGEIPIHELDQRLGGVASLVPVVQELLRDLRSQKQVVADLHEQYRQRAAAKTQSFERTIGSLRAQATKDALTGLYNRRMLDENLPKLIEQCKAGSSDLCVLMIDVDHFKMLNDTLGHAAGDALLRAIGQIIRSSVREQDLAIRNGGDEFVILLPGSNQVAGQTLADRLVSLIDQLVKTLRVKPAPRLSIGLASLSGLTEPTSVALLHEADARLYDIKFARKGVARGRTGVEVRLAS